MYHRPRIIPCLLLHEGGLVKTVGFREPNYLGDPINAVRIFNEKGVDELCVLDIDATKEGRGPDIELLREIASEAFMPLSVGGGITSLPQMESLFRAGFEKMIINSAFFDTPQLIGDAAKRFGSQSIVVSLDFKEDFLHRRRCYTHAGAKAAAGTPAELAVRAQELGAGELLINSINRDGTMQGYDLPLISAVSGAVGIPVVACGGAANEADLKSALESGAHAASAGSMFVYYGRKKAVLINFPDENQLKQAGIYHDE